MAKPKQIYRPGPVARKPDLKVIEKFIDFLVAEIEDELKKPYVDWMLAKSDFRTFLDKYLTMYKAKEGL